MWPFLEYWTQCDVEEINGTYKKKRHWPQSDSNTQPSDLESDALPLRHRATNNFVYITVQIICKTYKISQDKRMYSIHHEMGFVKIYCFMVQMFHWAREIIPIALKHIKTTTQYRYMHINLSKKSHQPNLFSCKLHKSSTRKVYWIWNLIFVFILGFRLFVRYLTCWKQAVAMLENFNFGEFHKSITVVFCQNLMSFFLFFS